MEEHQLRSWAGAVPGSWWRCDTWLGGYKRHAHPLGLPDSTHNHPCVWGEVASERTQKSSVWVGKPGVPSAHSPVGGEGSAELARGYGSARLQPRLCLSLCVTTDKVFPGDL